MSLAAISSTAKSQIVERRRERGEEKRKERGEEKKKRGGMMGLSKENEGYYEKERVRDGRELYDVISE